MSDAAVVARLGAGWKTYSAASIQIAVLIVVALVTRFGTIGDPTVSIDEQFYLVVADRMWHGAIPFVDIWDRKPIGLFLLYAFFRPFSVTGVAACQVGALLFAVATAWVITRIAKRFTNGNAALFAGVLYLIYLPIVDGAGGQSPVFYNLFMALAALLVLSATNFGEPRRLMRAGAGAMALVGIAMQVKYSAVVEGLWFGLALLWLHNRIVGDPLRLAGFAVVMISLALLPTVLVFGVYAASGHGAAFIDANVLSVLRRVTPPNSPAPLNLLVSAVKMTPILTLGIVAAVKYREVRPFSMATTFLLGWSAFAFAGFFVIGNYFDHYALPMLVPLSVLVATLFVYPVANGFVLAGIGLFGVSIGISDASSVTIEHKAVIDTLTRALAPYARLGCLEIFDGPPILYLTTGSCLPSRYIFPGHLLEADEARATDATRSMEILLRGRPSAIVVADRPMRMPRNRDTEALVQGSLAADYHLKFTLPAPGGARHSLVYVRNDLK